MTTATTMGNFNSKIARFNQAKADGDITVATSLGVEIVHDALEGCANPNTLTNFKTIYKNEATKVVANMASFARGKALATVGAGQNSQESEGSDPYYVEKQWFSDEVPNLNFNNIYGADEVKRAFMVNVVGPIQYPELFKMYKGDNMGIQLLLYGPPGTGKTHIAKCLAGALKCKIAVVKTSEILASVVGVAEKNIRDVFKQAEELDRCIIFIDEIDSLCSDRSSSDSRNTKSVLTTMLTCMDGFEKTKKENQLRIVIAATNLPWQLDGALKRGGRFGRQIYVPLPDAKGREYFVKEVLSRVPHAPDVTVDWLVKEFEGYSGADIKAALDQIADEPFYRAILKVLKADKSATNEVEVITKKDCKSILSRYINGATPELLARFQEYATGLK